MDTNNVQEAPSTTTILWGDPKRILFFTLALTAPFVLTWLITSWSARRAIAVASTTPAGLKRPPTLPYAVPYVGHLFGFLWDGQCLMEDAATYLGRTVPIRTILPIFSNYVVSGPENVAAYFKESRDLSTTSRSVTIMETAFGCPHHLVDSFKPQTVTTNPADSEDNIEVLIHRAVNTGLSGAHLDGLTGRYQEFLIRHIEEAIHIGGAWVKYPDLSTFVEKHVFEAAMRSMFGDFMLSLNPTLADDFWDFNRSIGALFMGLPKWMTSSAIKKRERMIANIKRWQTYVTERCRIEDVGDVDWEPYYGSKFIRERQVLLTKRGIMDETARASENFAFMWATNSNSAPAAIWFLLETLHDPSLRASVSQLLPASLNTSPERKYGSWKNPFQLRTFDHVKLCSEPLLQSMYAETLRLRVAVLVVREPAKDNYSFRGWHIKKNEALSISTRTEAMNKQIWNTGGPGDPHPLNSFWVERFIVDPAAPNSGPRKARETKKCRPNFNAKQIEEPPEPGNPFFSMDGLSASWIPYGGGRSLCPGRHFAKREIILTTAILLTAYDIQLTSGGQKPEVNMSCFGFGTMPPDRAIPFRIRRIRT